MNNPMQMMNMLKGAKTPKDAVMNMMKTNSNPMVRNLVEMAEKGQNDKIEEFARNLFKEQNKDFDQEFNNFKSMFNGK